MKNADVSALTAETLDPGLAPPLRALWWLRQGGFAIGPEWRKAHELCQSREGDPDHDLVHALTHWIEGDMGNAAYWYRRAGTAGKASVIAAEWQRIAKLLLA